MWIKDDPFGGVKIDDMRTKAGHWLWACNSQRATAALFGWLPEVKESVLRISTPHLGYGDSTRYPFFYISAVQGYIYRRFGVSSNDCPDAVLRQLPQAIADFKNSREAVELAKSAPGYYASFLKQNCGGRDGLVPPWLIRDLLHFEDRHISTMLGRRILTTKKTRLSEGVPIQVVLRTFRLEF